MTDITLPELDDNKKVLILYSGGINSTLLAKLAIDKYGVDNVVAVFNGLTFVRKIDEGESVTKNTTVLNNRIASFNTGCEALGIENKIILDEHSKFDSGIDNVITDRGRINYIDAFLNIASNEGFDCQHVFIGYEKLDFELKELMEVDINDGVLQNLQPEEVQEELDAHSENYPEVILHNVMDNFNDWFESNAFYRLDAAQYNNTEGLNSCTPLRNLTKKEIVQIYHDLNLDDLLNGTISCHGGPDYPAPCNDCKNCQQREIAMS